MEISSIEHC